MSTTSMSLESLHFLLQHMEANKRFEICQRCPALREFEKSVPLKINCLVLTENSVIVNNTTYEIGIIRKCKVGETPSHVAKSNEKGGDPYEIDGYGIRDELDILTVTPGDMVINPRDQSVSEEFQIGLLVNGIQHSEERLANLRERRPNRNLAKIHELEHTIQGSRARLFEFQCRQENGPSIYDLFFQLTKTRTVDKQEQKTFEKYKHNKKFSEAMKQLTTVLFGGRCFPIYVTKFQFCFRERAIRLPVGFKLHKGLHFISSLGIFYKFGADFETSLEALFPILNESSYPLKKLVIDDFSNEEATSPIVKTAGILGIRHISTDHVQIISAITNPVVHLKVYELPTLTTPFKELVEHWIVSKRPLGYEYTFYYYDEPGFAIEMEDIFKKLNGKPINDENVIIPMSVDTQLKVSYGNFPEFAPSRKWAFRFLTETVEH